MPESGLSQIQHSLAKILQSAGFNVMVFETEEESVLVIDAHRLVDDDKIRLLVQESGKGALMTVDANFPLQSWELILVSLLSVNSDGERLVLPLKNPLPRRANGSLDYGHIEFNEQSIKRVLDEVIGK